ncbi:MAG: protein phosphatase 2C domain-containing protein [Erysipelotrichaceae bacterium]|nr:protein phosphatase 2C domain-containing protein [Erysipelotrichaceae bacterium]
MSTFKGQVNGLDILMSRAKGQGHIYKNKPCQDYCFVKNISDDVTLLAVADGHGGERYIYSDEGSYTICHTLAKLVGESLDAIGSREWCLELKHRWDEDVLKRHEEKEVTLYGTTLLFAVITPEEIIAGQIGDGAILMMNEKQALLHKSVRPKVNTLTHSMAESHSPYYWFIERYDRHLFTDILLSTDGVFDPLKTEDQLTFYTLGLKNHLAEGDISQPFDFYGQNIMDYTFDDCTVIYASLSEGPTFDMGDASLKTTQKGLIMYETKDSIIRVRDTFVPLKQAPYLITPTKVEQAGDYYIYTYPKMKDRDLLMNSYYIEDLNADGLQDFKPLMYYYKAMEDLNSQLLKDGLVPTVYFYKSLLMSEDHQLSVFLDAIKGEERPWHSPLIGTLMLNDQIYPLLDYFNEDGFSPVICYQGTQNPFYCSLHHKEMNLIGIYNASKEPWRVLEIERNCDPGMVLPLNRVYHLQCGKGLMILVPAKG